MGVGWGEPDLPFVNKMGQLLATVQNGQWALMGV